MSAGRRRESHPDLELGASASARELRFEEVPETESRFRGDVSRRSYSDSRRRNLPDEVQSDVEYRDAGIEWRVAGWIETAEDPSSGERAEGGVESPERGKPRD